MESFLTREMIDAKSWYLEEHPIMLNKETRLEHFLRFTGLNQLTSMPSDEKILRMHKKEKGEMSSAEYWTKNICVVLDYVGLGKPVRWLTFQDYEESKDAATERVISMIPYGR